MATKTKTPDTRPAAAQDNGQIVERPDLSRCEYKTEKGRRCRLAVHGDDTDHVMVFRTGIASPKTLTELRAENKKLSGFTLAAEIVPTDEDVSREYTREAAERDEDQKRVDADALANYRKWEKARKPGGSLEDLAKKGLVSRYLFPPEAFDTIITMLRRAAQSGGPVNGKKLTYRRKSHTSGNAMVYFTFTDYPKNGDDS